MREYRDQTHEGSNAKGAFHRLAGKCVLAASMMMHPDLSDFVFGSGARSFGADVEPIAAGKDVPATESRPVVDIWHGQKIVDEFRWLEGDNSDPKRMGKPTDEVRDWTGKQNDYTRRIIDSLPGREKVEARIRQLMEIGAVTLPVERGGRCFYTKREGNESQAKIWVREGSKDNARLLVDPIAIDPSGLTALGEWAPSQDGKILAFSTQRAGDENTTVSFLDVDTGVVRADTLKGKAGEVEWLADNTGVFYRRLADPKDPYSGQIRFHRFGTDSETDPVLFRQYTKEENAQLATTWGPYARVSPDGRWLVFSYWTSTSSNDIWVVDLTKWWADGKVGEVPSSPRFERNPIKEGAPNTFSGEFGPANSPHQNTFFMRTDYGAAKSRVVAVDLNNPGESNWKVVVPENKDAVLTGFSIAGKDTLVATYEQVATSRIYTFALDGTPKGELKLPGIGNASVSTSAGSTAAYISYTSFNHPTTIFRKDLNNGADSVVWERLDVPVDPSIVEVKQVFYPSKDGTQIPMFIVHKKGLRLDGNNPTILHAYGGFGISMKALFSPTLFPWFEDGGVFAVANLRGGGEYGKAWHEAGILGNRQNSFSDMIAAAEYLIQSGYTNPNRLGASGSSNGGLLMGVIMTQRPDLFRAVVCGVPLLDMLRYPDFLMARFWVPEYGSPDNPEHFNFLKEYSPYHNIREGVQYPAVLFTAGENDSRTHPMHARKMAAALQKATASDPAERPVMLWVDLAAGHGQGKPLATRIADVVMTRLFFMKQLGMLERNSAKRE